MKRETGGNARDTTSSQQDPSTGGYKDLIRKWLSFAADGFPGSFETFIADDFVGHSVGGPDIDRNELERLERAFAQAFSGTTYEIADLLADGDRVVLRVQTRVTHRGMFYGIPATGRQVQFGGIVIYRIDRGRIAETWSAIDFPGLIRQLRGAASELRT